MTTAVTALRVVMALVLFVTGVAKAGHVPALAAGLAGYRLFPGAVVVVLSYAVPWFQIVVGAYMFVGLFTRTAAAIAAVCYVLYAITVAAAVVLGHLAPIDWLRVLLGLVLAALCALVVRYGPGSSSIDQKFGL